MRSFEVFPIVGGLLLGGFLGWIHPAARIRIGLPVAFALAFLATVASGEFASSWGFLLVDISLVAVSALTGLLTVHRIRWVPEKSSAGSA
jgi:hypothetical protein